MNSIPDRKYSVVIGVSEESSKQLERISRVFNWGTRSALINRAIKYYGLALGTEIEQLFVKKGAQYLVVRECVDDYIFADQERLDRCTVMMTATQIAKLDKIKDFISFKSRAQTVELAIKYLSDLISSKKEYFESRGNSLYPIGF